MNWDRYLRRKRDRLDRRTRFIPENQSEAKQALALGVIGISDYVEFSLTTEPLVDRIHDPDPVVRREAIRQVAENRTPNAIHMLREMLADEDEEVRLYAASELERLDAEMQQKIHRLRQRIGDDPLDIQGRYELAKQYVDYARLLLATSDLRHLFLGRAIELLSRNLEEDKTNPGYRFYRGWAYRLHGDLKAAVSDLKQAAIADKSLSTAFTLLAEIYFQFGRYDLVTKIMNAMPVDIERIDEYHAHLLWKNA